MKGALLTQGSLLLTIQCTNGLYSIELKSSENKNNWEMERCGNRCCSKKLSYFHSVEIHLHAAYVAYRLSLMHLLKN